MAEIVMPQLGESVTEGTITRWFKQVGDTVAEDEVLFEVSTDKVDSEVPSPVSGTITQILVPEGETVEVGAVLAIVGDGAAAPAPTPGAAPPAAAEPPVTAPVVETPAPATEAVPAAPPAAPTTGGATIDIELPQLGESVTEGTITRWFKQIGDTVAEDEPLFEVSTDKVDSEVPSPAAGTLVEIRVPEGETVDVGTVIAVLADGAGAPAAAPPAAPEAPAPAAQSAPTQPAPAQSAPAQSAPAQSAPAQPAPVQPAAQASPSDATAGRLLSPLVRRLVEENGLDPATITGTGVGGRITREDVLRVIDARRIGGAPAPAEQRPATQPAVQPAAQPPAVPAQASPPAARPAAPAPVAGAGDTVVPFNKIRRLTGEHMVRSLATSPHVITAIDVDYEGVERARRAYREQFKAEEGFSLTYLPFVSRAVVDALHEFPHLNATVGDGELIVHGSVNLSIAVDVNFEGLLAPVVHGADGKRLRQIARDINDLAGRARSKQLGPEDLAGGTFTISNSGSYGTLLVAPIINQPQVAILSTDGVKRRPVVVELPDGTESIAIHSVGNLTLSWDHRAFDGAYAAAFMARVKEILETRDWIAEI